MPRRFHTKSRFGCTVCKKRRIKCDERQPVCGGCAKLRVECSYSHPSTSPSSGAEVVESRKSASHIVEEPPAAESHTGFDLVDLTLMHLYATNTCQHLFPGEQHSHVWQNYIPTIDTPNGVLMHGILAVTALHQARLNPDKRDLYRARALHHHGIGLPLFKDMIASASSETAQSIVIYAILLSIWVYASHDITSEPLSLGEVLSTVEIARTGRSVFNLYKDIVITTPIGVFLIPPSREPLIGDPVSSAHAALETLQRQVEHPSDKSAVELLRTLMDRYLAGVDQTRSAAGWMASVGEDYWARVRERYSNALLIFAYSCLLTCASEHECWWLVGWPDRILLACSEILSPDQKEIISWDNHEELIRTLGIDLANLARRRDEKI